MRSKDAIFLSLKTTSLMEAKQCSRLGHTCDYSPRLSFRDDTPRVVERMQEISTVGSSVWEALCGIVS